MAVPFVLHSQPTAIYEPQAKSSETEATVVQRRYVEIMRDVEELINDHSQCCCRIGTQRIRADISQLHTSRPVRMIDQS